MKALFLAIAIGVAGVIAIFFGLSALAVPKEFATPASSVFLPAITFIHKRLDQLISKKPVAAFSHEKVVGLKEFELPGAVICFYGILLLVAATEVPSGILGLIAGLADLDEKAARIVIMSAVPIQYFLGYLVARWIGVRSGSKGIWLVLVVFTTVVSLDHLIRLFLPKETRELLGGFSPLIMWVQWFGGVIVWNILGLLGFWRGRKIQQRRYADYLLGKLRGETRLTLLSMMRDEVAAMAPKPKVASP